MTISNTNYIMRYVGNGTTTTFSVNFAFDILEVYVSDADGYDVLKVLNTDYTISSQNVIFNSAPANNRKVTILRATPKTQTLDLVNGESLPAAQLESELDKLTKINQEAPVTIKFMQQQNSDTASLLLPPISVRANKYLKFKTNGDVDTVTAAAIEQDILDEITALRDECITLRNTCLIYKNDAELSKNISQQWAESSAPITTGHYSAKVWAETAEATAIPDGSITTNKIADNAITFNKSTYFSQNFYITQLGYSAARYYLLFEGNNSKININFAALQNAGYNGLLIQLSLNLNFSSITLLDLHIEYFDPATGSTVNTQILSYSDSTKTFNGYMRLTDPIFWNPPINYNLRIYSNTNIVLNPNTTEYKSVLTITPAINKSNFFGLLT